MRVQRVRGALVALSLLLLPALAQAQSGITGVVRDTSGGVLPGVSVEASSPALIEGTRSAVTDGQGVFTITDLRPGPYVVVFSLSGFRTVRREGIDLPAQFTATVNADLAVGALEESITVSGEAPVVDIRSTRAQTQYSDETLASLPGSGRITTMINALPGATLSSEADRAGGGLSDRAQTRFSVHGAPGAAPVVDGMNNELAAANTGVYVYNQLTLQEVVAETSGVGADRDTGGAQLNMIPKEGGNTFSGTGSFAFSGPDFESSNLTDELKDRLPGKTTTGLASLKRYYDVGAALGGPIQRDKLWFFGATRKGVTQQYATGIYFNKLKQPESYLYQADLSRPGYSNDFYRDYSMRLTWQAAEKHKIALATSFQHNCNCVYALFRPQGGTTLITPEASTAHAYEPDYNSFVTWTYPATNRLLLTVAGGMNHITQTNYRGYDDEIFKDVTKDAIQITEQTGDYRYGAAYGATAGGSSYSTISRRQYHQQIAVAYVTGSHNFKSGVSFREFRTGDFDKYGRDLYMANRAIAYRFKDGIPNQLTLFATPQHFEESGNDIGFYAQDQWTIKRVTLNVGARYNNIDVSAPDQVLPAGFFVPERHLDGKEHIPNWKNFYPRFGAAYDLFGTGRTAIKFSLGGYADIVRAATGNPANDMSLTTNRNWDDNPNDSTPLVGDGDYFPDCNQFNPDANGECGAYSDRNFGKPIVTAARAADAREGFNKQSNNWQASVSVQHELTTGIGLNVGYFRTWYRGFLATDTIGPSGTALTAANYTAPFCVPGLTTDPRLPASAAQICGLYDMDPAFFGKTTTLVTQASNYGEQTSVYNGVDVTMNARFGRGGQFSGGVSTSQTVTDNCYQNDKPNIGGSGSRTQAFCHVDAPWSAGTQLKLLAVYPLPYDIQTSVIYQNVPGVPISASYQISNAVVKSVIGRNLSPCSQTAATCSENITVQLIEPNTLYEKRLNQFDLRLSKQFNIGGTRRLRGNFDVYNLFNTSSVLTMTTAYGSTVPSTTWKNAAQVLSGRLIKVGAQFDF